MTKADQAAALFKEGYSCSQAVCAAFAPTWGLDRESALKVAGGFGGGLGRMGEACGAFTGALMALGLRYASTNPEDKQAKEHVYGLARELAERFQARNDGCIKCRHLLGVDISTPDGLQAAREQGLFEKVCPKFVRDAAEILDQLADT
jgi:C_GCAxxG_C_C family probable redox protein